MFKSVYAKYISTFMLIIFVSFLTLVLIVTAMVNRYASNAKEETLAHAANGAAEFLGTISAEDWSTDFAQMINEEQSDVDRMLRTLCAMDDGVTLLLVDRNGTVVRMVTPNGDISTPAATLPRHVWLEAMEQSTTESGGKLEPLPGMPEAEHHYRAVPVQAKDGTVCGIVLACADTGAKDELLGVMIKTILIASLWVMLAALVAVYILTRRIIAPLKDMSRMAKAFAEGDYKARVRVRGNDEVSALATAFNDMADSISRLELMRNTFVANVSHDLRTPMTTISGFIDNILSGAIPEEKREYYLEVIRTEVQRLARLVNSLLDVSRIQAGDRKFDKRPFDICEMARRILFSFEAKIEGKRLDVAFDCDADRILALADYDAIYQILYNLCDNAVKFSKEQGKLSIALHYTEEQRVTVSVYNEGEGIAADDQPYVFERFYKGDKSRGLDKSGAGLGLFIAKTIMDAHHEKIWVESEQGSYCCFSFTLPLA